MGMARQIVGPDRRHVEKRNRRAAHEPRITAYLQPSCLRRCLWNLDTEPRRIAIELVIVRRDTEGRVVKKRDRAIRMAHRAKPCRHLTCPLPPEGDRQPPVRRRVAAGDVDEVQHVFQDKCMIHGAALEMAAIGEYLFARLAREDPDPRSQPAIGLIALEKQPGEYQCLRI